MCFDVDAVRNESVEFTSIVHLVGLYDEAVVTGCSCRVVACFGIDANRVEARSVVLGCERVVIGCCGICAPSNFELVAYSIAVGIADAVAFAVVPVFSIVTGSVVVRCVIVVVASLSIVTSSDFKRIAYAVAVYVTGAVSIAIVSFFSIFA